MEEKLLELFKLADLLNKTQNKLYAQIDYIADERKRITISIISKDTYTFVETFKIDLENNPYLNWNTIVDTFNSYIGGVVNE